MEILAADGNVDTIIVNGIEMYMSDTETASSKLKVLSKVPVDIKKRFHKNVLIVLPVETVGVKEISFEIARREITEYYLRAGIPVFLSLEHAAKVLSNLAKYYEYLDAVSLSP